MRQSAVICCLLLCLLGLGQRAFAQQDFRFLSISEKEGLPVRNLFGITATDDGMLWLASLYGLVKFDGETFEVLSHNPIDPQSISFGRLLIVEKSKQSGNTLWLGSATGGLCRFDGATEKAKSFLHNPQDKHSIGGNFIGGLWENTTGGLWVGTDNFTLSYLPPGSSHFQNWQPPLPPGVVSAKDAGLLGGITPDVFDANILWIGSRFGLYRFNIKAGSFGLHPFNKPFAYFYSPNPFPVCMDADGMLWTNQPESGLLRYDPQSRLWASWKTKATTANSNWLNQIFPLDDSLLLGLSKNTGLWVFNRRTLNLTVLDQNNTLGLPATELYAAHKSQNGDIWLATMSGLVRVTRQPQPVRHFSFPQHFPALQKNNWQRAYALSPDGRQLFMGTLRGDGLLIYDWEKQQMDFARYRSTASSTGWDIWLDDLCFDVQGRLWIGSEEGLLRFDQQERRIEPVYPIGTDSLALRGHHIASIAAGADGRLWLGTLDAGLFCFDPQSRRLLPFNANNGQALSILQKEPIKKVFLDAAGTLWIGGENQLYRYQPEQQQFLPALSGGGPGKLRPENISDIEQDAGGNIWLATFGAGLFRFNARTETLEFFNNPAPPGANWMYELLIDRKGELWMGTEAGIANFQPGSNLFANFGEKDGVNAVMKGALIQLPDGTILSGGSQGFHFFQPDAWHRSNYPPRPYLKTLSLFGEKMVLPSGAAIHLQHDQNHFSIEFSAVNQNLYPQTSFAYRMEGLDGAWVEAGTRRFVTYTNLPPGKYRFYLKAADKRGIWSGPVRLLELTIQPAFYQTWWSKVLAVALLFGLLMLAYKLRAAQIRRQERWKTKIDRQLAAVEMQALRAQMNPHFLHNSLNAINCFILENQPEQASKYLVKFSRLMRIVLDNSRLKKITLAQELKALHLYVEMEQIRFEPAFEFVLELTETLDPEEIEIPPLLLQPYLENAIWHGLMNKKNAPGRLLVRLWLEQSYLLCQIEDDGVGREAAAKIKASSLTASTSLGMDLTAQRLSLLQRLGNPAADLAVFDLQDEEGKVSGTRVELKIAVG